MSYKRIEEITNKLNSIPFTKNLYEKAFNKLDRKLLETSYLSDDMKGNVETTFNGTNNIRNFNKFIKILKNFKETNEAKKLKSEWHSQDGGRKTRKKRRYKKRKYKKQTYKKKN